MRRGIILGCTELPMLLEQKDFDLPLLATTQLHAQMAADFILEGN
jgi:aspartate racemase